MTVTTATATPVLASALAVGDTFLAYGSEPIRVSAVTVLNSTLVEVAGRDQADALRYLDHGPRETVMVTAGPTYDAALRAEGRAEVLREQVLAPVVESATTRATRALTGPRVLVGEPASIRLVLLALAAVEDAQGGEVSPAAVAAVAGLSEGTVKGYLGTLYSKGFITRRNAWAGYTVR